MTDVTKRISAAEWRRLSGLDSAVPKKRSKYNAQSTLVDGLHFPSKLEAAVWCMLKQLQKVDDIRNVTRYPSVKLPGGVTWKIDFAYVGFFAKTNRGMWLPCYAEAKGVETADYKVKLKLFEEFGDRPLHIWKGTHKKPYLWKTVIPKGMK